MDAEHIRRSPGSSEEEEEEEEDINLSSEEELMSDDEEPKDETELELERQVFGDEVAFKDKLRTFARNDPFAGLNDMDEDEDNALAKLDDADLFFLDADPDGDLASAQLANHEKDQTGDQTPPPAWEDSDDERVMISLMSVPRLRKLRNFEGEDVISGKEYMKRLRRQFETLNPIPAWARWTPQKKVAGERRRGSANSDSADLTSSDEDVEMVDSAQPLSKLLRSNEALTRAHNGISKHTVKLRPEVIAIERMKDILPTQPSAITSLSIHPHLPLLLSSGPSSTVYLHHINLRPVPPDAPNPLLTSLHLKHTPLTTSAWSPLSASQTHPSHPLTPNGHPKIYLSARRRYFHTWTLPTGTITKTTRIYGHQSKALSATTSPSTTSNSDNSINSMETLLPSPCGRYLAVQGTTRHGGSGGGAVHILDAHTQQWIAAARIDGRAGIAACAWWADGEGLCIASRGGEVSEWSVRERRVVWRWEDEGAVGVTTVALGGGRGSAPVAVAVAVAAGAAGAAGAGTAAEDEAAAPAAPESAAHGRRSAQAENVVVLGPDRWVATGSTGGIVNIYDRHAWRTSLAISNSASTSTHPTPAATLTSLTTPISALAFSPCGRLLVLASRWKRDALRLAYLPSSSATAAAAAMPKTTATATNATATATSPASTKKGRASGIGVYRNWPTSRTPLGRVSAVAVGEVEGEVEATETPKETPKGIVLFVGNEAGMLRGWEITG